MKSYDTVKQAMLSLLESKEPTHTELFEFRPLREFALCELAHS